MHKIFSTLLTHSITLSAEDVIFVSTFIAAIVAIFSIIFAVYRWYLHQQAQDEIIQKMKEDHESAISDIKKEQQLLTYGMLACLEGLKQLNCNGAVTDARDKLSKYLNEQAHKE